MLTRKQHELLLYIDKRLSETGVSPSFEEMKDALDLKSKSGVHRLISALEERGFIRRLANRARALEVLKVPGEENVDNNRLMARTLSAQGHPVSLAEVPDLHNYTAWRDASRPIPTASRRSRGHRAARASPPTTRASSSASTSASARSSEPSGASGS